MCCAVVLLVHTSFPRNRCNLDAAIQVGIACFIRAVQLRLLPGSPRIPTYITKTRRNVKYTLTDAGTVPWWVRELYQLGSYCQHARLKRRCPARSGGTNCDPRLQGGGSTTPARPGPRCTGCCRSSSRPHAPCAPGATGPAPRAKTLNICARYIPCDWALLASDTQELCLQGEWRTPGSHAVLIACRKLKLSSLRKCDDSDGQNAEHKQQK